MKVYVLVKDWGREGITVHGATQDLVVANAWMKASSETAYIKTYTDLPPESVAIQSERH